MTALVRTHYLDWERAPQASLSFYTRNAREAAPDLWQQGLYVQGPWEEDVPRTTDYHRICEFLFLKYNADDRPDGKRRRSMSVGDLVQIGGSYYVCASFGFEPVQINTLTETPSGL